MLYVKSTKYVQYQEPHISMHITKSIITCDLLKNLRKKKNTYHHDNYTLQ